MAKLSRHNEKIYLNVDDNLEHVWLNRHRTQQYADTSAYVLNNVGIRVV